MKTREFNIKRRQAFIDGFPMKVDELIRKLEAAKKLANDQQTVGFAESIFNLFNDSTLIVQWDERVPAEKEDGLCPDCGEPLDKPLPGQTRYVTLPGEPTPECQHCVRSRGNEGG